MPVVPINPRFAAQMAQAQPPAGAPKPVFQLMAATAMHQKGRLIKPGTEPNAKQTGSKSAS